MDSLLYKQKVSAFQTEPQSTSAVATHIESSADEHTEDATCSTIAKPLYDGISEEADIKNYLSRKALIRTFTVDVGATLGTVFSPWSDFLGNAAISRKLANYRLLKGDLILTFTIAGTPFHKGMFLASYRYLQEGDSDYVTMTATDISRGVDIVRRSQRPHVYLNASTNKGGCICAPFLHPLPYGDLAQPQVVSFANLGVVNIDSIPFGLEQINGGTDKITITVFAHMRNSVLTGPTGELVSLGGHDPFILEPQSEYSTSGIVSGPASAVASFAGMLSSVPYIGPFAIATEIGASAVGMIAKLFGYSKPAMIGDLSPMRNVPVSNMALTDGMDASQKLTVTGKAELTIDQQTVGMPAEDNLALYYYTKRESFVRAMVWPVTAIVGSTPFVLEVNPMFEFVSSDKGRDALRVAQTSLSSVTRCFAEWSGGLRYRFQVIASQYHRGKIAVVYEPSGSLSADPFVTNFHTIIDLAEGRDFSIDVKWQQPYPYAPVFTPTNAKSDLFSFTNANLYTPTTTSNGALFFVVVNELTVPDGVTDVSIAVSISALDDFELVNPSSTGLNISYTDPGILPIAASARETTEFALEPQSAVEVIPEEENAPEAEVNIVEITTGVQSSPDHKALMYYGERITSLRQLFKRFTFYRRMKFNTTAISAQHGYSVVVPALPVLPGWISGGFDTVGASSYNFVGNSFFRHMLGGFAGWRGSLRYKMLPLNEMESMRIVRLTGTQRNSTTNMVPYESFLMNSNNSISQEAEEGLVTNQHTYAGCVATQARTMASLEAEIPYTVPLNFSLVRSLYTGFNNNNLSDGFPAGDVFSLNVVSGRAATRCSVDAFFATGEDISLFGYKGAPRVVLQALPTV